MKQPSVYYSEIDLYCAQWLRNLMDADMIPRGDIDTRSIEDVIPNDLRGYTQCHFFAGLGGWAYALQLAGWGTRPVWTGSCPCQPFSAAGKGAGFADERHLWPSWQHLICQRNPAIIFGEQVTKAAQWLGLVCGDLEAMGYAVGFNHIEAASSGADHRRDRIFFVADTSSTGLAQRERERGVLRTLGSQSQGEDATDDGGAVGYTHGANGERRAGAISGTKTQVGGEDREIYGHFTVRSQHASKGMRTLGDSHSLTGGQGCANNSGSNQGSGAHLGAGSSSAIGGSHWIIGHDGKARRIEPGIRLLADGPSASMVELRAIEDRAIQEVIEYGKASQTNPLEVLRMVRQIIRARASRQGQAAGMRLEFPSTEILLDFLLCIEPAFKTQDGRSISKTLQEAQLRIVRSMWESGGNSCSPCEWESTGQHAGESSDALLALSFVLARHATAYQQVARSAHASLNRTGMLRALGNAIDPRPAATFITAYMQARGLIVDQQAVAA